MISNWSEFKLKYGDRFYISQNKNGIFVFDYKNEGHILDNDILKKPAREVEKEIIKYLRNERIGKLGL